ncbi:MAG: hypothetical protein ACLUB3_01180 [Clostridium sp.]
MDRFFRQKKMDQLFREYRDKVKQQRQNGQIVSDLEDILNEDVLALYSWQGVVTDPWNINRSWNFRYLYRPS